MSTLEWRRPAALAAWPSMSDKLFRLRQPHRGGIYEPRVDALGPPHNKRIPMIRVNDALDHRRAGKARYIIMLENDPWEAQD